jgi:hypothetical protein
MEGEKNGLGKNENNLTARVLCDSLARRIEGGAICESRWTVHGECCRSAALTI